MGYKQRVTVTITFNIITFFFVVSSYLLESMEKSVHAFDGGF